jgi:hypothetical protein
MKNNERYFRTTNFNLASFLFAKGIELANIDRLDNQKRATFVFVENPQIEELVHAFDYAKENEEIVMVDARKIIHASKMLKEKLYQNNY